MQLSTETTAYFPPEISPALAATIGCVMPDGTIYAGVSPNTGRDLFTTPHDAPGTRRFRDAITYAAALDSHGHQDWRIPAPAELHHLYLHRTRIGNFNLVGKFPSDWYWSSFATYAWNSFVWSQRFSDGMRGCNFFVYATRCRCVRG